MTDRNEYVEYPVSGILRVRKNAKDKVLSDTMIVLHNEDHVFVDFKVEGLDGYVIKFNERKRTITARKVLTAPKPAAESNIDKAFAEMGGSGDFTLDVESPAEAKFRAMCDKHGYSAVKLPDGSTLAERIRTLIQENGKTVKIRDAMNGKLVSIGKPEMSADDWKVAVAAAAAK